MALNVAILGATSRLAADFVREAAGRDGNHYTLFARDTAAVSAWLARCGSGEGKRFAVAPLGTFGGNPSYDAVVNFVGVGDPARARELGAGIFAVTRAWDDRAMAYVDRHPACRYVFLSSGAVYGDGFDRPAGRDTAARFPVNALGPSNWYALAKLGAEAIHRATPDRSIVDLRIFNYVSRSCDTGARYLITDAIRALRTGETLAVSPAAMVRDYLAPADLHALLSACLRAPAGTNAPADAYSRAPITKDALLALLGDAFGLRYHGLDAAPLVEATGAKPHYYSLDRTAAAWGYVPVHDSAEAVRIEVAALLEEAV